MSERRIGRRTALMAIAAAGGAALASRGRADMPPSTSYDVFREDSLIGGQRQTFVPMEGGFSSTVRTDIAVKLMGLTVYRYVQDGTDRWQAGRLREAAFRTDDNGLQTEVRLAASDQGLVVSGPAGRYAAPLGTMTDLCFWNVAIVGQKQLIDSQNGELGPITCAPGVEETVERAGKRVAAMRYTVTGTKGRGGTLWYDADGLLLRSIVRTKGEVLEFRLRG